MDLVGLFGKPPNELNAQCQLLSVSEFPSRVDQSLPVLLDDPLLGAIAKKHKRSPALIALRYQLQRGVVVLAKSYNKKRIKENMQVMRGVRGRAPNSYPPRRSLCVQLSRRLWAKMSYLCSLCWMPYGQS